VLLQEPPHPLSHRDLRLLRAAAHGRVECSGGAEPDYFVDGIPCCDHAAARALARAGLIAATVSAATTGGAAGRGAVHLTPEGERLLVAPR
jgi:hypothetical protein